MSKMAKIAKKEAGNSEIFLNTGINLENRIIHLSCDIDAMIVGEIISGIQLMVIKNQEPISIYINTFGGCPYSSFALYDYLRALETVTIKTYVLGSCMSGGTIIFLAGDEKYMFPNSVMMYHTVSSMSEGKLHELVDEGSECSLIFKQMLEIYAAHSNLSAKEWSKRLKYRNVYIREEEALKLQLITSKLKEG